MSPVVARSAEVPPRPGPPRHVPDVHVVPPPPLIPQVPIPQGARSVTTRWEYKRLVRGGDEPAVEEADLNVLGREGWELVGVSAEGRVTHFYFKRPAR
jgi:hypothetical protein